MVKETAQPYKHTVYNMDHNSLPRGTAEARPTHCHAGQKLQQGLAQKKKQKQTATSFANNPSRYI